MTLAEPAAVIRLWPEGTPPPTVIEGVPPEAEYPVRAGLASGTNFLRNISDPTLSVYAPAAGTTPNGVGIIVVPGGGWTISAWSHEGLDVVAWLTGLGYTAFLLKYRVQASAADQAQFEAEMGAMDAALAGPFKAADKPRAIGQLIDTDAYRAARAAAADDGRRAIALARQHAAEHGVLGVRPEAIGMLGFSAGAFLIVDVALDPRADQVAFIAPIYGGETLGAPVPADAPPLFTAVARDDILVRIVDGLYADWASADRPVELHAYARGAHGFGMVQQGLPSDRWTEAFIAWLGDLSDLG